MTNEEIIENCRIKGLEIIDSVCSNTDPHTIECWKTMYMVGFNQGLEALRQIEHRDLMESLAKMEGK